ncbi:hypothetical protein ACG9Y4_22070 [Acinetobacter guillouiae]|jgi:DNA-binding transcriptional regulator YiaG|uniref:hypothetical protein n=1 Tax=Acinetobacter guillouiae TaxID=106649 RepID=UPI003AF8965A
MLNITITSTILQEIEDDPEKRIFLITHIRNRLSMSIHEAANFCRVTVRTWQYWEARTREMPMAVAELFLLKLHKICNRNDHPNEGLVSIFAIDGYSVIDVVSGYNFLSLDDTSDSNYKIISSVAVDPRTNQSYIYKTNFKVDVNEHVLRWADHHIRINSAT